MLLEGMLAIISWYDLQANDVLCGSFEIAAALTKRQYLIPSKENKLILYAFAIFHKINE